MMVTRTKRALVVGDINVAQAAERKGKDKDKGCLWPRPTTTTTLLFCGASPSTTTLSSSSTQGFAFAFPRQRQITSHSTTSLTSIFGGADGGRRLAAYHQGRLS
ncbi:unnamed protein product [Fusarium langsethiae]|nr:unnamed protein product [Fusarium langsethiae]